MTTTSESALGAVRPLGPRADHRPVPDLRALPRARPRALGPGIELRAPRLLVLVPLRRQRRGSHRHLDVRQQPGERGHGGGGPPGLRPRRPHLPPLARRSGPAQPLTLALDPRQSVHPTARCRSPPADRAHRIDAARRSTRQQPEPDRHHQAPVVPIADDRRRRCHGRPARRLASVPRLVRGRHQRRRPPRRRGAGGGRVGSDRGNGRVLPHARPRAPTPTEGRPPRRHGRGGRRRGQGDDRARHDRHLYRDRCRRARDDSQRCRQGRARADRPTRGVGSAQVAP